MFFPRYEVSGNEVSDHTTSQFHKTETRILLMTAVKQPLSRLRVMLLKIRHQFHDEFHWIGDQIRAFLGIVV